MYNLNHPIEIHKWFLIVNPFAGNKNFKKSWIKIKYLLKFNNIQYSFAFTQYKKHEIILIKEALKKDIEILFLLGVMVLYIML